MVRKVAKENGVAFWAFVQAGSVMSVDVAEGYDTEGSLLWNVNTALAYGAKGIQYFTLYTQKFGSDTSTGTTSGIYNVHPFLNDRAEYVRVANRQIQAIDEILMNSYNDGVIFAGSMPYSNVNSNMTTLTKPSAAYGTLTSYNELTSINANHTLVGCFNYNGKTALYVVNNSVNEGDSVTLNFNNKYKYKVIQDANVEYKSGNSLSLSLKAREGVLIVLE